MSDKLLKADNETIYNKGRMDEKQATAIHLYCMDVSVEDIAAIVNESAALIEEWISNYKELKEDHDKDWDAYYNAARRYYEQNGNLNIDPTYVSPDGMLLGLWLRTQKRINAGLIQGDLTEMQEKRLEMIGIDWDCHTIKFNPDRNNPYNPDLDPSYEYAAQGKVYGYASTYSDDTDEIRRSITGYDMGIPESCIYIDVCPASGDRREKLEQLIRLLAPGDLVYVKSIDCLGRNYDEILKQWKYITENKKADIAVIDTPVLDTRRGRGMIDTLLTEVVLVQLSYISETQKINRKKRQAEGISRAMAKGVQFGRPGVDLPDNFDEIFLRYKRKELTVSEAADMCNMARTTFYDRASRYEKSIKSK